MILYPLSVYHVPCSIYYSCTCFAQAFWKIKHIILFPPSTYYCHWSDKRPTIGEGGTPFIELYGICKSDSIFLFWTGSIISSPLQILYATHIFLAIEKSIVSISNHYANRTSKSTCKPCAFACLCIVYHLISSFYATVLLPVCVFSERFKNCL